MDKLEKELKKEFQLERMILFSDAVFAIAITLLVIEIKVPHIEGPITDSTIAHGLVHLIPVFFGFLLSFFIIGTYWTVHHRMFGFLVNYDNKLLWLNLAFLLSIVIMPFTSGLYGEFYQPNVLLPNIIYALNICFTGVWNLLLVKHISDPSKKLSIGLEDKLFVRMFYARAFMMPLLFAFGLLLSIVFVPWVGRFAPALTPLYMLFLNKWYTKKAMSNSRVNELANT